MARMSCELHQGFFSSFGAWVRFQGILFARTSKQTPFLIISNKNIFQNLGQNLDWE